MKASEQSAFKNVKAQMSEHFDNFVFVILDESGEVFYGFKNKIVGKALLAEAVKQLKEEEELEDEYLWEDNEDGDEWGELEI